jgi:hypothetical protein
MDRLLYTCMSLLRLAARSLSFDLVRKVQSALSEMNHKVDPAVLVDCVVAAASVSKRDVFKQGHSGIDIFNSFLLINLQSGNLILTEEYLRSLSESTDAVPLEYGMVSLTV